jgi:hypothetical protein
MITRSKTLIDELYSFDSYGDNNGVDLILSEKFQNSDPKALKNDGFMRMKQKGNNGEKPFNHY